MRMRAKLTSVGVTNIASGCFCEVGNLPLPMERWFMLASSMSLGWIFSISLHISLGQAVQLHLLIPPAGGRIKQLSRPRGL